VITCIGSRAFPIDSLPFNDRSGIVENEDGKVSDRLYAVGWLKRGASGTIGTNKNDSHEVVDKITAEYDAGDREGIPGIDRILAERQIRVVSFADWQMIDRLEIEAAPDGAPRRKFITPEDMIAALDAYKAAS